MLLYIERVVGLTRSEAMLAYLRSGESMLVDLERILAGVGRPLAGTPSFLDFACGCGRFHRFLVCRLDPARVTAADIDPRAVEFVGRTFKSHTFVSAAFPAELADPGRYDVIFVASLFSHLSITFWTEWAIRLANLLTDDGVLVLSVHGPHAYRSNGGDDQVNLVTQADGFRFGPENETLGRLASDYYGTTYVTEPFVRHFFESRHLGRVLSVTERGLWDYQDVYVVGRA